MSSVGLVVEIVGVGLLIAVLIRWFKTKPRSTMTTLRRLPPAERRLIFRQLQLREPPDPDLVTTVLPYAQMAVDEPTLREYLFGSLTILLLGESLYENSSLYWFIFLAYAISTILSVVGQRRFRARARAYIDASGGLNT
ncbi:MAG: hypothetical protein ACYDHP_10155 [Ferrimicrobium sp.]